MQTTINCAAGTLAPYAPSGAMPWNKQRVLHLYRRMGFGASLAEVADALQREPGELIDSIIDQALALPPSPEPEWANWTVNDYENFPDEAVQIYFEWAYGWIEEMLANGFREKLALFWSNHFVTKFDAYLCPSYLYAYHRLLQEQALGNFKDFTIEMGKNPAMLVFLNGVQNTRFQPNENYARELFELFTLGRDNGYTQQDIVEAARALTGWNNALTYCAPIGYVPLLHDPGPKTIFGQTGNWDYDGLHELLFAERAGLIADHVCRKIYRAFVQPEIDEDIVAGMAETFLTNNFELAPVFRQLFKSEHFFDEHVIGTQIKSPLEHFLGFIREGGFPYNDDVITVTAFLAYDLGQQLYSPPDVAGWPGNRAWITSSTLTGRWQGADFYLFFLFENAPAQLVQLAKELSGNSSDPAEVTHAIVDHFLPNGLDTAEAYEQATMIFKWEVPQNYFDQNLWDLDWDIAYIQVLFLLRHIARTPEFQLA
jgi:uncharacterized protein (DUF1800 family)